MEIELGLDTIKKLLGLLDNPHKKLKVIHVAGTNGKGSTIEMISTTLIKAGYKMGKYTSPAVFEQMEMYQINDRYISVDDFDRINHIVRKAADTMEQQGNRRPTKFEVDTAIAFYYLAEVNCDIAIIETGMGGDLDATNVCDSVLLSVITSISLDHTSYLGDTLEEIAGHKAGIVKYECPVVVSDQSQCVIDVVKKRAIEMNASCYVADESQLPKGVELSLKGAYQRKNAATVVAAIKVLSEKGYDIPDDVLVWALSHTKLSGRFEIVCDNPLMIIDGAHNPDAVFELKKTLQERYAGYEYIFIMGVLADKDYSTEVKLIADMAKSIITITPDNPRSLPARELAQAIRECVHIQDGNVMAAETIKEAVAIAVERYDSIGEKRLILAFGSLSYMPAVKEEMMLYADRK